MGQHRPRRATAWISVLLLLTMTGCSLGEGGKPTKAPGAPPEWVSVETTRETADIVIEKVSYMSGKLKIIGQICRPKDARRHPVLISNHGGFGGLPDWNDAEGFCAQTARSGWVLAESSYRGEDGSDGHIEVCLGEVDDVLALVDIVGKQSYADPNRMAMMGISHGGCITSRAVEKGVDVELVVVVAGPSNWANLWRELHQRRSVSKTGPGTVYDGLLTTIEGSLGGTPTQHPEQYASRSPDSMRIARWDKPFLILHGGADSIVPLKQSCELARMVGDFRSYRFDASGDVLNKAPDGCEELVWNDPPSPTRTFNAERYLLAYDGVGHFLHGSGLGRMTTDLLRFLEAKLPS